MNGTHKKAGDGYRVRCFLKGISRVISGTGVAATFGAAGYVFSLVSATDGYLAAVNFLLAAALGCLGLAMVYVLGGGRRKKGGFEK